MSEMLVQETLIVSFQTKTIAEFYGAASSNISKTLSNGLARRLARQVKFDNAAERQANWIIYPRRRNPSQ